MRERRRGLQANGGSKRREERRRGEDGGRGRVRNRALYRTLICWVHIGQGMRILTWRRMFVLTVALGSWSNYKSRERSMKDGEVRVA